MLQLHRDERGQSLVIVLSLITLLFLLGSALAVHSSVALRATRTSAGEGNDLYAADAATELGIWWQRNGNAGNPPAQTINGNTTSTTITSAPGAPGICPASPTPIWLTGWESGYIPNAEVLGAGGTVQQGGATFVESSTVRTGNYSLKISPAGASKLVSLQSSYGVAFGTVLVMHEAIRFASLPAADAVVQLVGATGAANVWLYYKQSTGKWTVATSTTTWAARAEAQSSVSAVAGQWHTFDVRLNTSVNPLVIDWSVDSIAQPQLTNASGGAATAINYSFGQDSATTATYTAYYDDVILSRTSADFPLGDVRISALKPDAMGTHNTPANYQNDDDSAVNATSWQRVDEIPMLPASNTDYIKQVAAGAGSYIELAFEDTAQTCIRGASTFFAVHGAGGGNNEIGVTNVANGVSYTNWIGNISSNTIKYAQRVASQDAANPGVGPWTQAVINGITARIGMSTDVNPVPLFDAIVLEYGWVTIPSAPPTITVVGTGGGSTVSASYTDAGAGVPTLTTWTTTK